MLKTLNHVHRVYKKSNNNRNNIDFNRLSGFDIFVENQTKKKPIYL